MSSSNESHRQWDNLNDFKIRVTPKDNNSSLAAQSHQDGQSQQDRVSELLQHAMPLMGPDFDPERDLEDFSDDSSSEEDDSEQDSEEDMDKFFEKTFGMLAMKKTTSSPAGATSSRATTM